MKSTVKAIFAVSVIAVMASCSNPVIPSTKSLEQSSNRAVSAQTVAQYKAGVLQFFQDNFQSKIVSGQMNLTWDQSIDMVQRVKNTTGRYPALQGFDFMNYTTPSGQTPNANNQTSLAQAWWTNAKSTGKNGIVTFNWHWRDPSRLTDSFYKPGYQWSPGAHSSLHIPITNGNFDPNIGYGPNMVADMNLIAAELATLRDAGVIVLWRPLHEGAGSGGSTGSGSWFWWGYDGAAAYKALYIWMYNYFTNTKGLNNLIWVWNGQDSSYYPGNSYVDIGGWDVYNKGDHSALSSTYTSLRSMTNNKLVALTEVGSIPDPAQISSSGSWWSFFMTWNDGNGSDPNANFWSGDFSTTYDSTHYPWNTPPFETSVFTSTTVLTLDELPSLTPYASQGQVLYDFEASTQGWTGASTTAGPWSVPDWAVSGTKSLKADVALAAGSKSYLKITSTTNFSGKTQLSATAKAATWGNWGTGASAKVYVKTGAAWTWYAGNAVSLTSGSGGTALTLSLSGIPNLGDVKELGVEFTAGSGASGTSSIYVDKVVLQ